MKAYVENATVISRAAMIIEVADENSGTAGDVLAVAVGVGVGV